MDKWRQMKLKTGWWAHTMGNVKMNELYAAKSHGLNLSVEKMLELKAQKQSEPILIDGQERAMALGLIKPTEQQHIDFVKSLEGHPYQKMYFDCAKRFPHCLLELQTFFNIEELRNQQEKDKTFLEQFPGAVTAVGITRSMEWVRFFQKLMELELERHNIEVRSKNQKKEFTYARSGVGQPIRKIKK